MPIKVPSQLKVNVTMYENLKGVDYSKDPSLVDKEHSPNMVNLIPDKGGMPEKRLGFRTLFDLNAPINGIYYAYLKQSPKIIVHAGIKLYDCTRAGTGVELYSGLPDKKSTVFTMPHENKNKLCILADGKYLIYDGDTVKDVATVAKIPVVLISRKPSGGGEPYESVNLLQSKREVHFLGTSTDKIYTLPSTDIDSVAVTAKKKTASGETVLTENTDFTVNRQTGQVTFSVAPGIPSVEGEDNIFITYSKTVSDYANRILNCTISVLYGLGGSNRAFLSGNREKRNHDWWSGLNDPTYFPDINYAVLGSEDTAIMGYSKIGEYLTIIKEDNQQDTTIFIRSAQPIAKEAFNTSLAFPTKQGVTGYGAVSKYSFVNLIDEPLFLTRNGIYAITSNTVTAERTLQNRSYFVDSQLTKEKNLQNAVACEWNGFYLLGINGKAYILDSRQRSGGRDSNFIYECYLWDSIPATCFLSLNGVLYYGTADGKVLRMNTDVASMARYSDDGRPIIAVWESLLDFDNAPHMLKTMQKRGCVVTLKPFTRGGAKIGIRTSKDMEARVIKRGYVDIFDWSDIDFSRFTFNANDSAVQVVLRKKEKKYSGLQFVLVSDEVNEGFGLLNIVKSYVFVNYLKG